MENKRKRNSLTSVITGDIIASRNVNETEIWLGPLKDALNRFGDSPQNWEIYRGDSFQLEIPNISNALKVCIKLKANLKGWADVRVRLGLGIGEKTYTSSRLTESNGSAFVRSGTIFDSLKKLTMAISSPWSEFDREMNLYIALALLTMDSWSVSSAQAVSTIMEPEFNTQQKVADKLNISQGSVSARLQRAGFEEIMQIIDRYKYFIKFKLKDNK